MKTFTYTVRAVALAGLLAPFSAGAAAAQVDFPAPPEPPARPARPASPPRQIFLSGTTTTDRGYLGVTPRASSGPADTLGLLLDDVDSNLPAGKAGIEDGARLVSIDGIDLRVDPRDLGDSAAERLPESRLRRQLERKKPGETVTLVVYRSGRTETKRVVLADSPMASTIRTLSAGRRVLGISLSQNGSMRDTAGLLINDVTSGGAADRGGIGEGDRLVSIDGVDLRVPAEDAGSSEGADARVSRLRRALDAARDSQPVKLEVLTSGRRRTVTVVPTLEQGWTINMNGLTGAVARLRNGTRTLGELNSSNRDSMDEDAAEAQREIARGQAEAARETARGQREAQRGMAEAAREMARAQRDVEREMQNQRRDMARMEQREMNGSWSRDNGERQSRVSGTIRGRTDGATMSLSGLALAAVDRDFAQRFGPGSEDGALVVRSDDDWEPLRAGDVILTIEGRGVRDGNALDVTFNRTRELRVEILRNGRKQTVTLPSTR